MATRKTTTRPAEHSDDEGGDLQRLEVNVRNLLEEQNKRLLDSCSANAQNINQNAKSISALNDLIVGLSMQINKLISQDGTPGSSRTTGGEGNGNRSTETPFKNHGFASRMTKVEFPKFEGTDLRSWLYKCNQFFQLDDIEDNQRVRLAAIHLEGRALLWHQNYMKKCLNILPTWAKYTEEITSRFGELYDDPMADLKALKQSGSVQEYHDMFDALAGRLQLSEEHLLSCYLGGLDEEIQLAVRMFCPKSVQQALCLAKLQEASQKAKKTTLSP